MSRSLSVRCRLAACVITASLMSLGNSSAIAQTTPSEPLSTRESIDPKPPAPPVKIKISQASEYVDQTVEVEFLVRSSKLMADKKICFLNSARDHRDESNFSVVIKSGEVLDLFAAQDIQDPATHFLKKTVRVVGKVQLHQEHPQILVTEVAQVTIVDKPRPAAAR